MWCAHLMCLCLNMFELKFVNQHSHRMRHSNRRWPDLCVTTACSCSRSIVMISFSSLSRHAMIFTLPAIIMEVENGSLQYDRFLSFRVIFHRTMIMGERVSTHVTHIYTTHQAQNNMSLTARHVHSCHFGDSFCPPGTRTVYVETADHQRGHLAATVLHVAVTGGRSLRVYLLMPSLLLHLKTWSVCFMCMKMTK